MKIIQLIIFVIFLVIRIQVNGQKITNLPNSAYQRMKGFAVPDAWNPLCLVMVTI